MTKDLATTPAIDLPRIDNAVAWLNRVTQTSGLHLAEQISTYVVDNFFDGDPDLITSKNPHKTASFAALCARPDLQMGHATLYRLVRIGQQLRHLPPDLAERLSLTHHRALLAIDHAAHKQHVARQAAEHGWSAEELEAHIRAEQPQTGKPRGRPAQPAEVKWLNAVRRQATTQSDAAAFATRVGQLPAEAQATVRADLAALRQHLDALAQALG